MTFPSGPGSQGVPPQYQSTGTWVPDPRYQGGGWTSHPGLGPRYDQQQLEELWVQAGGSRQLAPVMAAIAYQRESAGYAGAWNSTGATGLWQIEWPGSAPPGVTREWLFVPENNARAAVRLSGNSLAGVNSNWSGDLQNISVPGFNPASHLPPGSFGPGVSGTIGSAPPDPGCLIGFPGFSLPIVGGGLGQACLLRRSQARAIIGGLLIAAGGVAGMVGLGILVSAVGRKTPLAAKAEQAASAATPGGKAAAAAGAATSATGTTPTTGTTPGKGKGKAKPQAASPSGTAPPPVQRPSRGPTSRSASAPKQGTYASPSGTAPPPAPSRKPRKSP